jgi:hypothetical protein
VPPKIAPGAELSRSKNKEVWTGKTYLVTERPKKLKPLKRLVEGIFA